MPNIRIGCQTYTWEMLGDEWAGDTDDILDAIAGAGYEGVEITTTMLGEYADRPDDFRRALASRRLALAAYAYASPHGFTDAGRWDEELAEAERALEFAAQFEGAVFQLGGAAASEAAGRPEAIAQAARFYCAVADRARDRGVVIVFHPHSHHGSVLESAEEYELVFEGTAGSRLQWNADTGHIVRGGQDLMTCLQTHVGDIAHVHTKDVDARGEWRPMGEGVCDFRAMFELLESVGYSGWVVAEEESDLARRDQVAAIEHNREYLHSLGY